MTGTRLTYEQARQMRRVDLVALLYDEAQRWRQRPPRTPADRAAWQVWSRCLGLVDTERLVDGAIAAMSGQQDGYLYSRPCDDPAEQP